jgi:hypothetical protein
MAGTPGRASAGRLPALDSVMRLSAASLAVALASVMVVDRAELGGNNNEADTELARVGFQSPLSEFSSSSEDEQSGPADATGLGDMESAERSFDTVTGAVPAEDAGGAAGATPVTQDDFGTVRDADAASPQASANAEIVGEAVPLDQEDSVTAARQFEDEDGGIGVIGVAEVVLAVLFGSALGGVLALGFARRRQQREGTNAPG